MHVSKRQRLIALVLVSGSVAGVFFFIQIIHIACRSQVAVSELPEPALAALSDRFGDLVVVQIQKSRTAPEDTFSVSFLSPEGELKAEWLRLADHQWALSQSLDE